MFVRKIKNGLYFFFFLLSMKLLDKRKEEVIQGLKNITPDELAHASHEAWANKNSFSLRGKEIDCPFLYGNGNNAFFISTPEEWKTKDWKKDMKSIIFSYLLEKPTDIARQRAYLLGVYGIAPSGY